MAIQKQHNKERSEIQRPNNMEMQKQHTEGKI